MTQTQTPQEQAYQTQLQQLRSSSPGFLQWLGARFIGSQRTVFTRPYYSRIRFGAARSGAGPYAYSLAAGATARAFSYGIGKDMASGGFAAGQLATSADTNIQNDSQTRESESLKITGLQLLALPSAYESSAVAGLTAWLADPVFQAFLLAHIVVQVVRDAGGKIDLYGVPIMVPGSGGQFGAGTTGVLQPSLSDAQVGNVGAPNNGLPVRGNFYPFPRPYYWRPVSNPDSSFSLTLQLARDFQLGSIAARTGAAGVQAFTPPSQLLQDFMVVLVSEQESARSANG